VALGKLTLIHLPEEAVLPQQIGQRAVSDYTTAIDHDDEVEGFAGR
jgi:hypothetical protein